MKFQTEFNDIYNSFIVQRTISSLFGDEEVDIVERPKAYILKLKHEERKDKISRIVLLPPYGFTANSINLTNSHPEVRKAKLTIEGGVRPGKLGFNHLSNVLKFAFYTTRELETEEAEPYVKLDFENKYYRELIKSSKESFFVVKENGEGFYHNLINLSDEWILLALDKELRLQKEIFLEDKMAFLDEQKKQTLINFIGTVKQIGDQIFITNKEFVNQVAKFDVDEIMPTLIEVLNIAETGKHEACTFYAMVLKIGKKDPARVIDYLQNAAKNNDAPKYYLNELIQKLSQFPKVAKNIKLLQLSR